jgi:hypothetical protein
MRLGMANPGGRGIRKASVLALLTLGLVLAQSVPTEAGGRHRHHHHGHRFHGHGHGRFFFSVGPAFYWGYPYWYPPPTYVYTPPPVVVQESPTYAQTTPAPAPAPQAFWYYCPSAEAYYPTAPSCPEAWVKVPPRAE